jgi:hypothetical protein
MFRTRYASGWECKYSVKSEGAGVAGGAAILGGGEMRRVVAVRWMVLTGTESDEGASLPVTAFDVLRRKYLRFSLGALR